MLSDGFLLYRVTFLDQFSVNMNAINFVFLRSTLWLVCDHFVRLRSHELVMFELAE